MKSINVDTPFKVCDICELFDIVEGRRLYSYNSVYHSTFECPNRDICINFAKLTNYSEE